MWRSSFPLLKHGVTSTRVGRFSKPASFGSIRSAFIESNNRLLCGCLFSTSGGGGGNGGGGGSASVDVEALKSKLGNEVVRYSELLQACESMGVAKSPEEAKELAKGLDDAGAIFIFRDKVSLHPQKVMDLVRRAVPLALMPQDDPQNEELKMLQAKQQEIDVLAQKQVKRILWAGLGLSIAHVSLFFRLTFWEFSWDVMEPITFFTASSGLILGYAYFLFTSRDPSYQT